MRSKYRLALYLAPLALAAFVPSGPYTGPNTRLGLATMVIWHNADHHGQMTLHLRLNGIVPPASRPNPPEAKDLY
ncbi:MAG TPA: hypothetical protein VGR03_06805 [Candidatus Acidoferrum sp.]|nr:hypothetical protein [Candidatus Acidoferrum sp.]